MNELEPNKVITTSFLVHSKEIRQKKGGGEFYLSLLLGDRTGELDAKMWDNVAEVLDSFDRDDFVKVKGLIQVFHNRPQLTIHKVRRLDDSEIDYADYFPSSKRDPEEMWRELQGVVAGIANPHLQALLSRMLADPDVAQRYRRAPAAKQIHHAFLGGLIEHVLSLCGLARLVAPHYANIDADLLLTGVVLHDIGKIYELNYERGFSYSNDGQLIGHISIAMRMVSEKLRDLPDFPLPLRSLVEHMILSHHGQLEFGSPKLPLFPEALLLHYLDDMDSKMECMRALIANDRQVEGCFTTYSPTLDRPVLKKDRYCQDAARPESAKAVAAEGPRVAVEMAARIDAGARQAAVHQVEAPRVTVEAVPPPKPPAPPAVVVAHPLFAPKPDSPFGDKLKEALLSAGPKQES
ncbi:MAG TPA: HD domain-containing protein [Bryobacteraceae bacterium]|nr:HD domain-containing protein [Bryobacteraceae bacterium]